MHCQCIEHLLYMHYAYSVPRLDMHCTITVHTLSYAVHALYREFICTVNALHNQCTYTAQSLYMHITCTFCCDCLSIGVHHWSLWSNTVIRCSSISFTNVHSASGASLNITELHGASLIFPVLQRPLLTLFNIKKVHWALLCNNVFTGLYWT